MRYERERREDVEAVLTDEQREDIEYLQAGRRDRTLVAPKTITGIIALAMANEDLVARGIDRAPRSARLDETDETPIVAVARRRPAPPPLPLPDACDVQRASTSATSKREKESAGRRGLSYEENVCDKSNRTFSGGGNWSPPPRGARAGSRQSQTSPQVRGTALPPPHRLPPPARLPPPSSGVKRLQMQPTAAETGSTGACNSSGTVTTSPALLGSGGDRCAARV